MNIDLSPLIKYQTNSQFGNINMISLSKKRINNEETDIDCILFVVDKKMTEMELRSNRISKIPKKISLNGVEFITDILEGRVESQACSNCNVGQVTPWSGRHACGLPGYITDWGCGSQPHLTAERRNIVDLYRRSHRPVVGGISVSSIQQPDPSIPIDYANSVPNLNSGGTLGFVAVDSLTKNLVGVTNTHVLAKKGDARPGYNALYRTTANKFQNETYDFTDLGVFQSSLADMASSLAVEMNAISPNNIATWHSTVRFTDGSLGNIIADIWNDYWRVGNFKRYMPLKVGKNSAVDCAIFDLINVHDALSLPIYNTSYGRLFRTRVAQVVATTISWRILGFPTEQRYFPFASTTEINSLTSITNPNIYTAGRSSGGRGLGQTLNATESAYRDSDCQFKVFSTNVNVSMAEGKKSDNTDLTTIFNNCVSIGYRNCNEDPSQDGDSGSAVLADFNGVWKIIGLLFASGVISGQKLFFVSRIDNIAPLLRIEPYMGQSLLDAPPGPTNTIVVRNKQGRSFFNSQGRTYFQVGTTTQTSTHPSIPTS